MALGTRSYARGYASYGGLPPAIKSLLIWNIAVFVAQFFLGGPLGSIFRLTVLRPTDVMHGMVWQLVTYLFMHGGFGHIFFNMLALWMFGRDLEAVWGTRRFFQFYFFCGIGAGLCVIIGNYLFGNPNVATIGASGAIYGVLLASALLWPDREILIYFLFPIKMKYFVMIIGAIAFMNSFNPASPVSNVAHLGGMLFAYAFLKLPQVRGWDPLDSLKGSYREWRIGRARRKFEVYMKKHGSDEDRTIH